MFISSLLRTNLPLALL
jgi:hypothetical protein